MGRLILTVLALTCITILTLAQDFGLALCVGVGTGALLFLPGALFGARLGNIHGAGGASKDVNMRLGTCLALAGIASAAQGQEPSLSPVWRVAIGMGQGIVSALGILIAWRGRMPSDKSI